MSSLYKNILVPLDGSDLAAHAVPHAEAIAAGTGAKVILLQVVDSASSLIVTQTTSSISGAIVGGIGIGAIPTLADEAPHIQAMDEAKREMDDWAETLRHRKIETTGDIDTGDPATCILGYAAANNIDLIVMSTHGRTGLSRLAYGSVANKVLQSAPCPVLVVRSL